ncbi:MAG: methionine--tRNA ligase [Flavobacteriales bacterium]|nr:methionine--tRNA ligase [Flavobacteriales bacterium]
MESNTINRYTVTAALPYANGPVHIGHLAGCYIPADIYVRYLRLKGKDVLFVCGSDEHGIPITIKAKNESVSPQEVVDKYHAIMKNAFDAFGIDFDIYSRTSADIHKETASAFFLDLYKKGELIEKETEEFFDPEANEFLADRYIVGTCPSCSNPDAYGDQCEKCGKSLSPEELINPISKLSGAVPVKRKTVHWYIDLGKHQDEWLKQWIESKKGEWKSNVMGQCLSWMGEGENKLKPRAVTRDLKWGVPVPAEIPGHEGKMLYVWFDAPIGYISATKDFFNKKANQKPQWVKGNSWEDYWAEGKTNLIHFIGKDNIVFHCIIFPSMLKSFGNLTLPANVPANEFLNLEGDKISTSRNWAVWLHEYLQDMPGREDELRYVLTANMPETKDNDFIWKYDGTDNTTDSFQARVNNELVNNLGNFVNRVMVLIHKFNDGKIPVSNPLYVMPEEDELYSFSETQIELISSKIENFEFRAALSEIMKLSSAGNKFLQVAEPWKTYKKNPQAALQSLLVGARLTNALAILIAPFLPHTSKKLAIALNLNELSWISLKDKSYMHISGSLNPLELLFKKVEENEISVQLEKLETNRKQGSISTQTQKKELISPSKPEIQFDDFSKIDIRIGTIIHAEKVPKADKLLKLSVNTGIDTRTILSGIAEHFTPEEVIGKQVTVLVNLAPRKMRGIESQGMILMAEDADGKLVFVKSETMINPGSEVR